MADAKQRITLPFDVALFTTFGNPGQEIPSHKELHGTGDVIAMVTGLIFSDTRLHEELDELLARIAAEWDVGHDERHPVHDSDHVLRSAVSAAVEEGARIGVALFATLHESGAGWQAWTDRARAYLQRSGCDADVHTADMTEEIRELGKRLRAGQQRRG